MPSASASGTLSGNTVVNIKASSGRVQGYFLDNTPNSGATTYFQFFNAASVSAVTLGTTAPVFSLGIPGGQSANLHFPDGVGMFPAGICIAQTTTFSGSTAPSSNTTYNIWYL